MKKSDKTEQTDLDLLAFDDIIKGLPKVIETKVRLSTVLNSIHQKMNRGHYYQDILDFVFSSLDQLIPFERIGIALLEDEGRNIRLNWVKSKLPINSLKVGYSASMQNSSLQELITSERPRIINNLEEYYKGHPDSKSTEYALRDGIRSSLTYPLIANGKTLGVIFFSSSQISTYMDRHIEIFREISEGLSLIIEQQLLKQEIEKTATKEKIFRDTIHDLNNPLTIILMTLDLSAKKDWFQQLGLETRNAFTILKRNCESMLKLVGDLGQMHMNEQDKPLIQMSNNSLENFLSEILNDCKLLAEKKNIQLTLSKTSDLPREATFDSFRLKEALENLVSNAVKFSKEDTSISIHVNLEDGNKLFFSVKDQGQGIPSEELSKLFKEFGKTTVSPTSGETSSGLGLSIVKRLIEAHKGEVFVNSSPGVGSTFSFYIPLIKTIT